MSLFDDQAESDFKRALALVEQTIRALGIDPTEARHLSSDGSVRFGLRRGSASIVVSVHPRVDGAPRGALRVTAPVVRVPSPPMQLEMFRRLLECNARELVGFAFGLLEDDVVIAAERSLQDLDASEVESIVRGVGREADRYDDMLAREYETTRANR